MFFYELELVFDQFVVDINNSIIPKLGDVSLVLKFFNLVFQMADVLCRVALFVLEL